MGDAVLRAGTSLDSTADVGAAVVATILEAGTSSDGAATAVFLSPCALVLLAIPAFRQQILKAVRFMTGVIDTVDSALLWIFAAAPFV